MSKLPPWLLPGEYYDIAEDEFVTFNGADETPQLTRMLRVGRYYGVKPLRGPYAPGRSW